MASMSLSKRLAQSLLVLVLGSLPVFAGCQANRATGQLEIWEGPQLLHGRMSATLGAVKLQDGRVVVVGGSPSEYPFAPLEGKKAIEMADSKCIMSNECRQQRDKCNCWYEAGVNLNYPIAGFVYPLPDGRLLALSSVFVFDPDSERVDPAAPSKDIPTSGPVSAVIIDLRAKTVTPIYRPKGNVPGNPPLSGKGPALLQRAFDRSLQLKDGRILRIGGELRLTGPSPVRQCKAGLCQYCKAGECTTPKQGVACKADTDCPEQWGRWDKYVIPYIEIYTPPDPQHPLGSVKVLEMNEGRSSVSAIQLRDGRVLITGGWGPKGDGKNQNYITTYFLDPNPTKPVLSPGPRMLFYREDHAASMLSDGRILFTGGTDHQETSINQSEIFDPAKGIFIHAPSMTLTREDHIPVPLGPWLLFLGGEVNDKADQIRNTAEIYNAANAEFIGTMFMYSRPSTGADKGLAGVTDAAVIRLDSNTLILAGGQQGLQDRDGEYISAGKGSRRTLMMRYAP